MNTTTTLPRVETLKGSDLKKNDLVVSKGAYNAVVASAKNQIADAQKGAKKIARAAGEALESAVAQAQESATMAEGAMEAGTYAGTVAGRLLDHATDGPKFGKDKGKEAPLSLVIGVPLRLGAIFAPNSWGPLRAGGKGLAVGFNCAALVHIIDQIKHTSA